MQLFSTELEENYVIIKFFKLLQEFILFKNFSVTYFYQFHVMKSFRTKLTEIDQNRILLFL